MVALPDELAGDSSRVAKLPADHGPRLFEHFSVEAIHELMSAIAQSAMNPVEDPMCRKPSGAPPAD